MSGRSGNISMEIQVVTQFIKLVYSLLFRGEVDWAMQCVDGAARLPVVRSKPVLAGNSNQTAICRTI